MTLDILKNIKKSLLLLLKNTYIYENEFELEKTADWIIEYINSLESKKEKGILALEVQEGKLHLVENFTDGYIVWFQIPLLKQEDFKQIYDILKEKLNLTIGLHHAYGISRRGFDYNIFINKRIIDLLSDNEFDKEWLSTYYKKDNLPKQKSLTKNQIKVIK